MEFPKGRQSDTEVRNDTVRQSNAGHRNDAGRQNNTEFHSGVCSIHDTEHQNNAIQQNNMGLKRKGEKGYHKEKMLNNDEKPSDNTATQEELPDTESAGSKHSSKADGKKGKAKSRNEELKGAVTNEDKASDEKEFHFLMILPPPPKPELPGDAGRKKEQVRWTAAEREAIRRIVSSMVIVNPEKWHDLTAGTERRWAVARDYLESKKLMKIDRSWSAIKNYWNRKGRESTGIDERRRPRTTELTTGFQPNRSRNEKAKKRKLAQDEDGDAGNHNGEPIPKKLRAQIEQGDSSTKNKGSASKRKHAQAVDDSHQSQTYEPAPKKSRTWANSESLQQAAHQYQDYQVGSSQSSRVPNASSQPSSSLTEFFGFDEFGAPDIQQLLTQQAEQDAGNEQRLRDMFPDFNREVLGMIFAECNSNMVQATNIIICKSNSHNHIFPMLTIKTSLSPTQLTSVDPSVGPYGQVMFCSLYDFYGVWEYGSYP